MKTHALSVSLGVALSALILSVSVAHADRLYAVRPLDGYACAKLKATEAQMLNPQGSGMFVLTESRSDAPRATIAPSVLFVRHPSSARAGYVEVMQASGKLGWIAADRVGPMDTSARCVPSVMSNGRIGLG